MQSGYKKRPIDYELLDNPSCLPASEILTKMTTDYDQDMIKF